MIFVFMGFPARGVVELGVAAFDSAEVSWEVHGGECGRSGRYRHVLSCVGVVE